MHMTICLSPWHGKMALKLPEVVTHAHVDVQPMCLPLELVKELQKCATPLYFLKSPLHTLIAQKEQKKYMVLVKISNKIHT